MRLELTVASVQQCSILYLLVEKVAEPYTKLLEIATGNRFSLNHCSLALALVGT